MKKVLILVPFLLNAGGLKSLLNHTQEANLVKAKELQIEAKRSELRSVGKEAMPTVDLAAFISDSHPRSFLQPGTIYGASVKLKYAIYDGGLKQAKKGQKRFELASAKFNKSFFSKSLYLQIVQDYYNIKSLDALIDALKQKQYTLNAQLKKTKVLVNSGFATDDNLYSLKAALALVKDNINSLRFQRKSLLKLMSLKANYRIKKVGNSHFIKRKVSFRANDLIRALRMQKSAILSGAKMVKSATNPHINLDATYNLYAYGRSDRMHPEGQDHQAKINLTAGIRLYDGRTTKEKAQAIKLQAMSLGFEIKQKLQEQRVQYRLSKQKLTVAKEHISAMKAQYRAEQKLFTTVKKQYESGLADYVSYLDALSQMVSAKANLAKARYELEIAYALYYYNAGYDIRKFVVGN